MVHNYMTCMATSLTDHC